MARCSSKRSLGSDWGRQDHGFVVENPVTAMGFAVGFGGNSSKPIYVARGPHWHRGQIRPNLLRVDGSRAKEGDLQLG